jgi:hypothetical protein
VLARYSESADVLVLRTSGFTEVRRNAERSLSPKLTRSQASSNVFGQNKIDMETNPIAAVKLRLAPFSRVVRTSLNSALSQAHIDSPRRQA